MKKEILISTALISSFLIGTSTVHAADDYKNHYMKYEMQRALNAKIIDLDSKGNFYPKKNMTRAEFASMITRKLNLTATSSVPFKDVTRSHKYYKEIQAANASGIIVGYNEKEFKPDKLITREEMVLMIYRYLEKVNVYPTASEKGKFKDQSSFMYPTYIQGARNMGIVGGYEDNTYRSKNSVTKADAVGIFVRATEKVESITGVLPSKPDVSPSESVQSEIITNGGFARTNQYTLAYKEGSSSSYTYFSGGSELKLIKIEGDKVYVDVAGVTLYVNKQDVTIYPNALVQESSYYTNKDSKLYHYVYLNNKYSSYLYGNAPSHMAKNVHYYSYQGNIFNDIPSYNYYNYLPLRSDSSYTGEELDRYIKSQSPDSPLIGYGQVFIDAANKYNINPIYFLANAIHESGWGKSAIAKDKNNLFGFKAVDADAYNNAAGFATLEEGIYYCAYYISEFYLTPGDFRYQGSAILGNKSIGMNVKYASDPYWGQKIAGHMFRLDSYLGKKDMNKYVIGTIAPGTKMYTISNGVPKQINNTLVKDRIVAKVENVQTAQGVMTKIFSDDPSYPYIFVQHQDFKELKTY